MVWPAIEFRTVGSVSDLKSTGERGYVQCAWITRLPAGQRVDSVDLHEAPALPERLRGLVGAVAGRAIQGLRLNKSDPVAAERVENLLDQERANASTTAVPADSRPEDLRRRARLSTMAKAITSSSS